MRLLPRRRWVRWTLGIPLGLILVFLLSEGLAEWKWRRYAAEARARGVKLTLADLDLAPIPDAENFAAQAIFREAVKTDGNGPRCKVLEAASGPMKLKLAPQVPDGAEWLRAFDLAGWRDAMLHEKWLTYSMPDESAAAAVLRGLVTIAPELNELRAARSRPRCRYEVNWGDPELKCPHLSMALRLVQLSETKIVACYHERNHPEAMESLRDLQRLAASFQEELTLLSCLVWRAGMERGWQVIRRGLDTHFFFDEDLAEFERWLGGIDVRKRMVWAMESERAWGNSSIERLMKERFTSARNPLSPFVGTSRGEEIVFGVLARTRRFWRENQLRINQACDELTDLTKSATWDESTLKASAPPDGWLDEYFLALAQNYQSGLPMARMLVLTDTRLRALRLQCALERYRLEHGAFPEKLELLSPKFLAELPRDPLSSKSFHYQRTEAGYRLYSVGWNRTDDGGAPGKRGAEDKDKPDLVWPYPALLPELK